MQNIELPRLLGNASVLVIAGSETTATLLAGVTYLLLRHPEAMKKVVDEVRSSFKSEEDITLTSVGNLTYMLACLNEGTFHGPSHLDHTDRSHSPSPLPTGRHRHAARSATRRGKYRRGVCARKGKTVHLVTARI